MKCLSALFVLCGMTATLAAAPPDAGKDSLPSLDDMPQWIVRNMRFPAEACRCGVAGIERFVVSAAWDGRVFITSRLDALHPCYEGAVKQVVARARVAASQARRRRKCINSWRWIFPPWFRIRSVVAS